jgi:phosphatidate cytidylyltransferase
LANNITPEERERRTPTEEIQAQFRSARADIERQLENTKAQFEQTRVQFEAANEMIQRRTGRNLLGAIAAGLIFGAFVLVSLLIFKWLFVIFAVVVLGICTLELANAMRVRGWYVPRILSVAVTVIAMPVSFFGGLVLTGIVIALGTVIILITQILTSNRAAYVDKAPLRQRMFAAVFVQAYVSVLGAVTVNIVANDDGQWWVLGFLIVVASIDTGAYVTGLLWGKHLMAPKISPKKTWEGFAGAGVISLISGGLVVTLMLDLPLWFTPIFSIPILFSAVWGDLGESQLKRIIGVKDMSNWLAGHGGFLDRLDSILPTALVVYIIYFVVHRVA